MRIHELRVYEVGHRHARFTTRPDTNARKEFPLPLLDRGRKEGGWLRRRRRRRESRGEENLPGSWSAGRPLKFTRYVLGIPLGLMILTRPNILEEATDAPRIKLILLKFTFTFPFPQLVRYTPVLPGNIYLEIAFPDKSEGEGTYQVYRAIKFIATTKRDAFRLLRFPITDGYARISRRSRNSISSSVDSLDPVRFREIDRFREAGGAWGVSWPRSSRSPFFGVTVAPRRSLRSAAYL